MTNNKNQKANNTAVSVLQDSSELFYATPTSAEALLNSKFEEKINSLISQIQSEVEDVQEIIWWMYRVSPHDCIACDIYGSDKSKSLNLNITIAGGTVIPSDAHDDSFDLQDATDAHCLLALIVEKFQLKHVRSVPQGLQFSLREIER